MQAPGSPRYLIVTPARDEADYLPDLIRSLLAQHVPFARWVIVDDGSTDGTLDLARGLESEDGRVSVLARTARESRRAGCGDIEAFNAGLSLAGDIDGYDYIGKLDADLVLPPDYFRRLFAEFDRDPLLGIAGGHCYNRVGDRLKLDRVPDSHVRGATKTYRRDCFQQLRPLPEVPGWDTVDEVRARGRGWTTRSFRKNGVIHQKPVTGGSGSVIKGRFVLGGMSHYLGYLPSYFGLRVIRDMAKPPYVVGAVAMALGYVSAASKRAETLEDPGFLRELHSYQRARIRAFFSGTGSTHGGLDAE